MTNVFPNSIGRFVAALTAASVLVVVAPDAKAISSEEVITLTKLGIAPKEIIKAIEKDRTVFSLAVADILALKKARVHEDVLKFMLATPQKWGKKGGAGAASPQAAPEPEQPAETEEERLAREERMRQDALRLLAEKKKAEEAQRAAYAKGVLAKGRALADEGRFVEAIKAFQKFMAQGGYAPDSKEAYLANFGIANALVKAGLHQAAARQLLDVVLAGPEQPFFQTAFKQLRELRKKVNYSPPGIEELTRFFVGGFSQAFQDEYNYVLGEFYADYNNWTNALKYLVLVSPNSPDYARAQYLKGLIEVRNQMAKSAVESFQRAILATDENGSDPAVRDLAYLALARIAYEIGDGDAAIYYYRKVPADSYKGATALYESAWVYFIKGDVGRALGTFHTLHSPYFKHQFYPELWLLEATMYMNVCRFDYADAALTRYRKDITPLGIPLKEFLLKTVRPKQFYRALVDTVAGRKVHQLPEALTAAVLRDVEFYNLYRTIKQIESELKSIGPHVSALGEVGQELEQKLKALHADRVRETGIKIQRILKETETELADFEMKATELEIDLQDEKLREEERKLLALENPDENKAPELIESGGAVAIVGSDKWQWPFQDEYWRDEIGSYRAFIKDMCAPAEAE